MDDKVKDLIGTAMGKIKELSDADTIIGDAIKIDGNITIIPVSKVSYGFAAGGSDLPSKTNRLHSLLFQTVMLSFCSLIRISHQQAQL